jgi:hypothetical protein
MGNVPPEILKWKRISEGAFHSRLAGPPEHPRRGGGLGEFKKLPFHLLTLRRPLLYDAASNHN